MVVPSSTSEGLSTRRSWIRLGIELAASLAILVTLFRAFLAGGYMIETGSMAPCLVGFHWQGICPNCHFSFAVEGGRSGHTAVCPNCGKSGLNVEAQPRNDGDHLLVDRAAFEWRKPRRWEVIIFRNPNRQAQALVKRVVGLPGETLELKQGDLFIDGKIQAKGYATQCGMRIPVYDHDFRPDPDDPDWQPRWLIDQPAAGWSEGAGRFVFTSKGPAPAAEDPAEQFAWVNYRHWIRYGGMHKTSVPLEHWPARVPEAASVSPLLAYDESQRMLVCRGTLSRKVRDELLQYTTDPDFRQTLSRLYEASHIAPITDNYGYNRGRTGGGQHEVRDLMIALKVELHAEPVVFAVRLSDGAETLQCELDAVQRQIRLVDVRTGKAVRTADLPAALIPGPARVEFSLMDRQALVAVNGYEPFEAWSYPTPPDRGSTPWQPVRLGARGGTVEVSSLQLYRDVYYTPSTGESAYPTVVTQRLGADEYYTLGDNSPVSRDSRSWSNRVALSTDLLLGKPLVVHLPSRKGRFRIGSWQTEIRIPEASRIRYIH